MAESESRFTGTPGLNHTLSRRLNLWVSRGSMN